MFPEMVPTMTKFRPQLSQLEAREVPAVLVVNGHQENGDTTKLTLREAIDAVYNGSSSGLSAAEQAQITGTFGVNDKILFSDSLAGVPITFNTVWYPPSIYKALVVDGGSPNRIRLTGGNSQTLLQIGDYNNNTIPVTLKNLTFFETNGAAVSSYGQVTIDSCIFEDIIHTSYQNIVAVPDGNITIRNTIFRNNITRDGAVAIGNGNSADQYPENFIIDCSFTNNQGGAGGGAIKVLNFNGVAIQGSHFEGNSVDASVSESKGGAIYSTGKLIITNSTFLNNAANYGGAIWSSGYYDSPSMTITGSLFSGNQAKYGAGVLSGVSNGWSNKVQITNSTFTGNVAVFRGGGIMFQNSSSMQTLTNVTVVGNRADATDLGSGAGVSVQEGNPTVRMFNSLVIGNLSKSNNTPSDMDGTLQTSSANNLIGDASSAAGLTNGTNNNIVGINGSGNRPWNTVVGPITGTGNKRVHPLVQNSLAIGGASTTVPGYVAYDQRETPRGINSDAPDIGAYEVQHPLTPVGVPQTYARTFLPKPSASANEAFIKGLYQSTLLRAAEPAGLQYWLDIMNSGTRTLQQIAYGFVNSTENRVNQVTFYYRYFLSREPDTAGLNFHVNRLVSGVDEAQLMTEFILSQEYSASNTNAQFVNLMYYAILGRQADSAGYNGWLNALNGGATRQSVVSAFVRSQEGITRIVNSYFAAYLKRPATQAELNQYQGLVNSQTFGITASQIIGSQEFLTAAGQHLS
jgi:predicted outer membrane repeat protein